MKCVDLIPVAVLSGEYGTAAGGTDRVGRIAVVQSDSFLADSVDVWRGQDGAEYTSVGTDGLCRVVVRHDEQNVGPLVGCILGLCRTGSSQAYKPRKADFSIHSICEGKLFVVECLSLSGKVT